MAVLFQGEKVTNAFADLLCEGQLMAGEGVLPMPEVTGTMGKGMRLAQSPKQQASSLARTVGC